MTHEIEIKTDMVLALYTDGMTEFARDALAGEQALCTALPKIVAASIEHPARVLYELILGDVVPPDDAALMLLQFSSILNVARMDDPSRLQEWRFHASDAQAAHVARREIGAYIRRLAGDTEASNSSELIVGELIANTVEHAPGLVHLMMEWTDAQPVFTVRDSGPGLAAFPTELPADIMNERSRGLFLAHSLASSVTVTVSPTGGAELRVVLPLVQRIGEGPMRTADDQHRGDS